MGCYGIGVSRIVAAAIEQGHDANGIIFPVALAPFQVGLIPITINDAAVRERSSASTPSSKPRGWKCSWMTGTSARG